jgi:putative transposase
MPPDPQRFFLDFLPTTERQVQPEGIRLRNLWYQSDALKNLVGLQDPRNPKFPLKVMVRTDPVDLSRVFVLDPLTNVYFIVPLRTLGRPAISLRELQVIQKSIRDRLNSPATEELIFKEREYLRALVDSSAKQTKRVKVLHQRTRRLLHQTVPLHVDRLTPLSSSEAHQNTNEDTSHCDSEIFDTTPLMADLTSPTSVEWPDDFGPLEDEL